MSKCVNVTSEFVAVVVTSPSRSKMQDRYVKNNDTSNFEAKLEQEASTLGYCKMMVVV